MQSDGNSWKIGNLLEANFWTNDLILILLVRSRV